MASGRLPGWLVRSVQAAGGQDCVGTCTLVHSGRDTHLYGIMVYPFYCKIIYLNIKSKEKKANYVKIITRLPWDTGKGSAV